MPHCLDLAENWLRWLVCCSQQGPKLKSDGRVAAPGLRTCSGRWWESGRRALRVRLPRHKGAAGPPPNILAGPLQQHDLHGSCGGALLISPAPFCSKDASLLLHRVRVLSPDSQGFVTVIAETLSAIAVAQMSPCKPIKIPTKIAHSPLQTLPRGQIGDTAAEAVAVPPDASHAAARQSSHWLLPRSKLQQQGRPVLQAPFGVFKVVEIQLPHQFLSVNSNQAS